MPMTDYKVTFDQTLRRFVAVDSVSGEVIDNGRGFGYKSAAACHRGYGWKRRNLSHASMHSAAMVQV